MTPAPIRPDRPLAGFYKRRLIKGGPWVPVMIGEVEDNFGLKYWFMRHGEREIDDQTKILELWPYLAKNPIDKDEYDYLVADMRHAGEHRPLDAKATPEQPVDWTGHNLPPSDDLAKAENLIERAHDWVAVKTLDSAHEAINLVKQITVLANKLDAQRKDAAKPHKDAATEAELPYRTRLAPMAEAKAKLLDAIDAYRRDKGLDRIGTDLGAVAFERTTYGVQITDFAAVPPEFRMPNLKAIAEALRAGEKVPGAELVEQKTTVVS